jgi:hypothetical protein
VEVSVPDQQKTELAGKSDELLETLQKLKETEQRKRAEPISSEPFHELANEVDALSHDVWAIARDQDHTGEQIPTSEETIDEVAVERDGLNGHRKG